MTHRWLKIGAKVSFEPTPEMASRLRVLARAEGATLYLTHLLASQILIARYSEQKDIAIGTAAAGSSRIKLEPLIGLFANTLVLLGDLSGEPICGEFLARVRRITLDAFAHGDTPLEKVVDALQPERNLGHLPMLQVVSVFQNAGSGPQLSETQLGSLRLTPLANDHRGAATYDSFLSLAEQVPGLAVFLKTSTDFFDEPRVHRAIGDLQTLLEAVAIDPTQVIGWLPLPTSWEQQAMIAQPLTNHRVCVLDDHQLPMPIGVSGELYETGGSAAQGYLHSPELMAERFLPIPLVANLEPKAPCGRTTDEDLQLTVFNLSDQPRDQRDRMFLEHAEAAQRSLDLVRGPLVRPVYFETGDNGPARLLIVIHHWAIDAVSWRILLEDLHRVYFRLASGLVVELPPKTTAFGEWARPSEACARCKKIRAEAQYWLAAMTDVPSALPIDDVSPASHDRLAEPEQESPSKHHAIDGLEADAVSLRVVDDQHGVDRAKATIRYTPFDLPDAGLSESEVDALLDELGEADGTG